MDDAGLDGHAQGGIALRAGRRHACGLAGTGNYTWYRDGLVRNFREAVDIATRFANLTSSSSQSAFDTLDGRWTARVNDLKRLQDRLDAQQGPSR